MSKVSVQHDQAYQKLIQRLDACIKGAKNSDQLSEKERIQKLNQVELAFESLRSNKTFDKTSYLKMSIK